MGTTYTIGHNEPGNGVIELDEMSNTLVLIITRPHGSICSDRMKPEKVIQMALEMLKVCSYWTEEGTIEKAITAFKTKGYSW